MPPVRLRCALLFIMAVQASCLLASPSVVEDQGLCNAKLAPTVPPRFLMTILDHAISSLPTNVSSGIFTIQNDGVRDIAGVAAIIAYYDSNGKEMFQMSYYSSTQDPSLGIELPFAVEYQFKLDTTIRMGERARIHGTSSTVMSVCPNSAELTFIMLHYADGKSDVWSAPSWQSAPVVRALPALPPVAVPRIRHPITIRVAINEVGHVSEVHGDVTDSFRSFLTDWEFYPAKRNGIAVRAEIGVLVRVNSYRGPDWTRADAAISKPVMVLDLVPTSKRLDAWEYYLGGYPGRPTSSTAKK